MAFDRKASSPSPSNNKNSSSKPNSMHIDLSTLPALIQPTPPSNTLLITQLSNSAIFTPETLSQIHALLTHHAAAPLHSFTPLKSMRRIIITCYTTEAAIGLRSLLDGENILGCRVRVYFGINTPLDSSKDQYLAAPDAGRLFFISPPPSPPLGWTMRNEDPPNKAVHADDLASALAKLRNANAAAGQGGAAWGRNPNDIGGGVAAADMMDEEADLSTADAAARRAEVGAANAGANATVVYHPRDHGRSGNLPAVLVEDVSGQEAKLEVDAKRMLTHTARPPVELMLDEDMDMS